VPLWLLIALSIGVPFVWGSAVARFLARRDAAKARFVAPEEPGSDYSI
jgi:hypothetical protein